jgi:hypothetical protein
MLEEDLFTSLCVSRHRLFGDVEFRDHFAELDVIPESIASSDVKNVDAGCSAVAGVEGHVDFRPLRLPVTRSVSARPR